MTRPDYSKSLVARGSTGRRRSGFPGIHSHWCRECRPVGVITDGVGDGDRPQEGMTDRRQARCLSGPVFKASGLSDAVFKI